MREILFRGKRIDNGEWVYGDLYHGLNNMIYINTVVQIDNKTKCNKQFLVQYKTVSQYTCLKDKNGVKVFEGDLLNDDYDCEGIFIKSSCAVVYDCENAEFAIDNSFKQDGSSFTNLVRYVGKNNLEVIGNIHDK